MYKQTYRLSLDSLIDRKRHNNENNEKNTDINGLGYQYEMGGNPFFDYNAFKQLAEENGQYYDNVTTTARNVAFFPFVPV